MEDKMSAVVKLLQPVQLIVTAVLAVFGFLLNQEAEEFKRSVQRIEADLKQRQENRADQESAEKLRFQIFGHVSSAIEKKDLRQQEAAKALVIALLRADDILRAGLIEALSAQAEPAIKSELLKVASQEREYRQQEDTLRATVSTAIASAPPQKASNEPLTRYFIDVFYCEKDGALKSQAEEVAQTLSDKALRVRLRVLADSVNASPGYRVDGLQLRYNEGELNASKALQRLLAEGKRGSFLTKLVSSPTPNYMSVFVCG